MKLRYFRSAAAFLTAAATALLFCSCSFEGSDAADSGKLNVVCTLFPQYDFVREIAGDSVNLTLLLPPGVESHSYDPTPADMRAVSRADLLIRVGENMETWSQKLFSSRLPEAARLDLARELGVKLAQHEHEDEPGHEDGEARDPHLWTDPLTACDMVRIITRRLCELDPDNASLYDTNCERYISSLEAMSARIEEIVAAGNGKPLVFSGRFALKNFTLRYGLEAISTLDACADNSEPGAATVAAVIDAVNTQGVRVVFFEELVEPRTAEVICGETGAQMLLFHSCHNLSRDEFDRGESYLSLMTQNAENLREALS